MKDRLKKIMTSLSEWREQVNTIATVAEPSEAQTVELTELRGKLTAGETEYRAALDAEGDTEVAVTAEDRARRELRPKARLTSYIGATVDATPFTGAEAEFAAAHACRAGFMPLEMLLPEAREERDVTPGVTAPGATATIAPFLFERTASAALGIQFPTVGSGQANYPVLTTRPTAGALAQGSAAPATAGAFRLDTRTPKRVSGAFEVQVEDLALLPGMEESLRGAIGMVLGDALDSQVLTGNGTAPNFSGVFQSATDVTKASATETFQTGVARFAALVDGQYAYGPSDMRAVIGVDTYALYASLFQGATTTSLYDYLNAKLGGLRVTKRVPAKASGGQKGLVALTAGSQPIRVPIWQGVQLIRDIYGENAKKGQVTVTAVLLAGNPHLPYGASTVKEIHPKLS